MRQRPGRPRVPNRRGIASRVHKLSNAAYVGGFVTLTADVARDGILTAFERRHVTQPAAAPRVLHWSTQLGERKVAGSLVLLAGALSHAAERERLARPVVRFIVTIGGRALIARAVRRARPPRTWWQETPSGYSFPSRHTTWFGLGAHELVNCLPDAIRPWARAGEVVAVGSVAISRIRLGVHWPTDVIGALLWGECCRRGTRWAGTRIAATRRSR